MDLPYIIGFTLGRATPAILIVGIIILIVRRVREKNQPLPADGVPAPPKRRTSKGLIITAGITLVILIMFAYGVGSLPAREKVFSKEEFSITLTEDFKERINHEEYFVCYESRDAVVFVLKEEFSVFARRNIEIQLSVYADAFIFFNDINAVIEESDGLLFFEHNFTVNQTEHMNFGVFYEGADAFWVVQFGCETRNYSRLSNLFREWAKSVKTDGRASA
jgi:hypothetical protein